MGILQQLGLDHTYFYQLVIFIFALIVLSQFVFKDFAHIIKKREHKTQGGELIAEHGLKKAAELGKNYEDKAKQINGEIKAIFDFYRQEASAEYEKNISAARASAGKLVDEARQRVASEVGDASKKIKEEAPLIANEIVNKLVKSGGR